MKVRFYCDIPSHGVRLSGLNPWSLHAMTAPASGVMTNFTRVAFDVDIPSHLIAPEHDVIAPASKAMIVEEEK